MQLATVDVLPHGDEERLLIGLLLNLARKEVVGTLLACQRQGGRHELCLVFCKVGELACRHRCCRPEEFVSRDLTLSCSGVEGCIIELVASERLRRCLVELLWYDRSACGSAHVSPRPEAHDRGVRR